MESFSYGFERRQEGDSLHDTHFFLIVFCLEVLYFQDTNDGNYSQLNPGRADPTLRELLIFIFRVFCPGLSGKVLSVFFFSEEENETLKGLIVSLVF